MFRYEDLQFESVKSFARLQQIFMNEMVGLDFEFSPTQTQSQLIAVHSFNPSGIGFASKYGTREFRFAGALPAKTIQSLPVKNYIETVQYLEQLAQLGLTRFAIFGGNDRSCMERIYQEVSAKRRMPSITLYDLQPVLAGIVRPNGIQQMVGLYDMATALQLDTSVFLHHHPASDASLLLQVASELAAGDAGKFEDYKKRLFDDKFMPKGKIDPKATKLASKADINRTENQLNQLKNELKRIKKQMNSLSVQKKDIVERTPKPADEGNRSLRRLTFFQHHREKKTCVAQQEKGSEPLAILLSFALDGNDSVATPVFVRLEYQDRTQYFWLRAVKKLSAEQKERVAMTGVSVKAYQELINTLRALAKNRSLLFIVKGSRDEKALSYFLAKIEEQIDLSAHRTLII